jgi:hypothetical protein
MNARAIVRTPAIPVAEEALALVSLLSLISLALSLSAGAEWLRVT